MTGSSFHIRVPWTRVLQSLVLVSREVHEWRDALWVFFNLCQWEPKLTVGSHFTTRTTLKVRHCNWHSQLLDARGGSQKKIKSKQSQQYVYRSYGIIVLIIYSDQGVEGYVCEMQRLSLHLYYPEWLWFDPDVHAFCGCPQALHRLTSFPWVVPRIGTLPGRIVLNIFALAEFSDFYLV